MSPPNDHNVFSDAIKRLDRAFQYAHIDEEALLKHTDTGKKALAGLQGAFGEMKGYITKSMGSIMNALSAGDMEGAMELSSASIKLIWTRLTTWLQTLWEEFKGWWSGHTNSIASVMIDALAIGTSDRVVEFAPAQSD